MSYPASQDEFAAHGDGQVIEAGHINALAAAITAVEAELGNGPSAGAATVAARLSAIEGAPPLGSATSWPLVAVPDATPVILGEAPGLTLTVTGPASTRAVIACETWVHGLPASGVTLHAALCRAGVALAGHAASVNGLLTFTYQDSGLTPGQAYAYTVKAWITGTSSNVSVGGGVVAATRASAPMTLSAVDPD